MPMVRHRQQFHQYLWDNRISYLQLNGFVDPDKSSYYIYIRSYNIIISNENQNLLLDCSSKGDNYNYKTVKISHEIPARSNDDIKFSLMRKKLHPVDRSDGYKDAPSKSLDRILRKFVKRP